MAGTALRLFQAAAASWERAELALQTNITRRGAVCGGSTGQGGADDGVVEAQLDVAAAPVAFGADPADHPGGFEHLEVVGEQVGAQVERFGEVAGGRVAGDQLIGQGEADWFTERRVHRGPLFEVQFDSNLIESSMVEMCQTSSSSRRRCSAAWWPSCWGPVCWSRWWSAPASRRSRCRPSMSGLQLLENSLATVLGLAVLILVFGPVSGAHFNPVVSVVDWLLGRRRGTGLSGREVVAYAVGPGRRRHRGCGAGERDVRPARRPRSRPPTGSASVTASGRSSPPPGWCC